MPWWTSLRARHLILFSRLCRQSSAMETVSSSTQMARASCTSFLTQATLGCPTMSAISRPPPAALLVSSYPLRTRSLASHSTGRATARPSTELETRSLVIRLRRAGIKLLWLNGVPLRSLLATCRRRWTRLLSGMVQSPLLSSRNFELKLSATWKIYSRRL